MNEPNFGWGYPPGAENDPRAPYNQPDPPEEDEVDGEPDWDVIAEQREEQERDEW